MVFYFLFGWKKISYMKRFELFSVCSFKTDKEIRIFLWARVVSLCVLSKPVRKCKLSYGFGYFPMCSFKTDNQWVRIFLVRCFKPDKEIRIIKQVRLFSCALFQNRQEMQIALFVLRRTITKIGHAQGKKKSISSSAYTI